MKDPWIKVGFIANLHGLRGEAKVESLSDVPDRWQPGTRLYLGDVKTPVTIAEARPWKHMWIVRFSEWDAAEQLEPYKGAYAYVREADRPELTDDVWYMDDLIGLRAVDSRTGTAFGKVAAVLETLANDVLAIQMDDGKEELVPFVKERTGAVNLVDGTIEIDRWEEV